MTIGLLPAGALWHYKMCLFDTSRASGRRAREGTMATMLTAIGLMSGTSLDGVDVALIETDGRRVQAFGPSGYRPYSDEERSLLRQALTKPSTCRARARPGILREAERAVTIAHAEAVAAFTAQNRISATNRYRRLSRPDRAAPSRAKDDRADRRRHGACQGHPYPGDA